jgi:collagen type VII alpha
MAQASVFTNRSGNVGGGGSASQGSTGPTGAAGATGETGVAGPTGATGAAGAGVTWKGTWAGGTAYVANDVVYYSGIAYLSILAGTNKQPNTETSYWDAYTAGITGPTGATGDTGAAGAASTVAGPTGATGTTGVAGAVGPFGGNSQKFTFSNSIVDSDPGSGVLRLDHATVSSATKLFIDDSNSSAVNIENWIGTLDDNSTSSIRGTLTLFDATTPANYAIFNINNSNTSATGYKKVNVTHVTSNGSFTNGNLIVLSFVATGEKGDTGTTGNAGPTGLTGVTGTTGPSGSAGATGAIGAVGAASTVIGPTGPQGIQGSIGPTGSQGATGDGDKYATTSSTSLSISTGSTTLNVGTNLSYSVGQTAIVAYNSTNQMSGGVTSYNSGTGALVVNVSSVTGSGTYAVWSVNLSGAAGPAGVAGAAGSAGSTGPTGLTGLLGGVTHTVTYQTKTSSHPYHGTGSPNGFSLDGTEGKNIVLLKGYTYYFNLAHSTNTTDQIYISTSSTGGGSGQPGEYLTGVSTSGALGTDYVLTFTVPHTAPSVLYYWGTSNSYLGGTITISDKGPTGATGSVGATGAAGSTGPTGAGSTTLGPTGAIGPAGGAGPTGPTGSAGVAGAVGSTGAAGAAGPTGATGAAGAAGATGAAGVAGAAGDTGAAGAAGAKGDTGSTGAAGDESVAVSYAVTIVNDKYYISKEGQTATTNTILNLYKGFTYEFDLSDSSNSGKTFKFSETADGTHGSSGVEYTTGATTIGTAGSSGAKVKLKVSQTAANVLYYYAAELPSAGGTTYLDVSTISTGATGATGAAGVAGAAGAAGSNGAIGAAGATGATGSSGSAGSAGVTGATGAIGATGAGGATHTVTVSNATGSTHFYLNGAFKDGITVFRGFTYYFDQASSSTSGHQIYIATAAGGAGANNYSSGQSYSGAAGTNGILTFTVPHNAPSNLYYECASHSSMGGTISVTSQGITGAKGDTGVTGPDGSLGPAGADGPTGPTGALGAQGNAGVKGPTGSTGPGGSGGTAPIISTKSMAFSIGDQDVNINIFDTSESKSAATLSLSEINNSSGVVSEACTVTSFKVYITQNSLIDTSSSVTASIYKNGTTTNIETVLNSTSTTNVFYNLTNSVAGQSDSLSLASGDRISMVVKALGSLTTDVILFKLSGVTTVGVGATGPAGALGSSGNTGPTGASGSVNTGDIVKYSLIFG